MRPKQASAPPADLVLIADLDRLARAECYERLRRETEMMGVVNLADIFGSLAQDSFMLLPDQIRDADSGSLPSYVQEAETSVSREVKVGRTAYEAWIAAVDIEREATSNLVTLLSRSKDPKTKQALLHRIHQTEDRVSAYRVHRRAAYHSEKIGAVRAAFPDNRRIHDAGDLALVALAIEKWFLHVLDLISDASEPYCTQIETTRTIVSRLESLTGERSPPPRLSKWLQRLTHLSEETDEEHRLNQFQHFKITSDAGRIFDYYDRVFEDTEDEDTQTLAQWLSIAAIERLKALRDQKVP